MVLHKNLKLRFIECKIDFRMKKLLKNLKSIRRKLGRWIWVILTAMVIVVLVVIFSGKGKKNSVTATVERGKMSQELTLSGQIKAEKHAVLYFPASGKISWVGIAEGDVVKKWQGLMSLDKTTLNAAYQQALNNYRNYQASAENVLDSVKNHDKDEDFSTRATRTAAEVARDNAYDAVIAAEYNLNNATLIAPFDGIVSYLAHSFAGINVMVTEPQVEIVDPKSIYFAVSADQEEILDISTGQKVSIKLDSYDGELTGKVVFVGLTPKSGETSTVYEIKVNFDDLGDKTFRVGMTGDALFILNQKEDALYVPSRFVNTDKDGRYVFLGSKKNKVYVKTGIEGENDIEIVEGVSQGDILYD